MISAMPAVAVRHERRRGEKRGGARRPSQLPLQAGRTADDPTPSPDYRRSELYVCGKVAALHAIVGSILLGVVVTVVGLVQLSPGAEAAQHRFYLMGCGAALLAVGVLGGVLRAVCLHWYNRKLRHHEGDEESVPQAQAKQSVSVVDGHEKPHGHEKQHGHEKSGHTEMFIHIKQNHDNKHVMPKLKNQASVSREADTLIKQTSATSDT